MENGYKIPIQVNCGYACKNGFWLCHSKMSVLLFYSYNQRAITNAIMIPNIHGFFTMNSYSGCILNDDLLILSPYNTTDIVFYNISKNIFEMKRVSGASKYQHLFCGSFIHGDECILFPCKFKSIVKINLQNRSVSYLPVPIGIMDDDEIITKFIVIDNIVIATLHKEKAFLMYNITFNKWYKKTVVGKGKGFSRFIFLKDKFYVLNYSKNLIECFEQNNFKKAYELNAETVFGHPIEIDGINLIKMDESHIMINVIQTGECIVCDCTLNILRNKAAFNMKLNPGYAFPIEDIYHSMYILEKYRCGIINGDLTITFENIIDESNISKKIIDYCCNHRITMHEMTGISVEEFLLTINNSPISQRRKDLYLSATHIYHSILGNNNLTKGIERQGC